MILNTSQGGKSSLRGTCGESLDGKTKKNSINQLVLKSNSSCTGLDLLNDLNNRAETSKGNTNTTNELDELNLTSQYHSTNVTSPEKTNNNLHRNNQLNSQHVTGAKVRGVHHSNQHENHSAGHHPSTNAHNTENHLKVRNVVSDNNNNQHNMNNNHQVV